LIEAFAENPNCIVDFGHEYYYSGSKLVPGIQAVTRQLIIPFVRDYKAYVLNHGNTEAKVIRPLSKKVFVVHGHVEGAWESVARFLESLGFAPIILHEQANNGRTVIEKVEANSMFQCR
jgi:predicted nucleotide-binding protein